MKLLERMRRWIAGQSTDQIGVSKHLAYFYDQPFVGMTITSPSTGGWLEFNDRMCAMLGYSRDEFAEKAWRDMIHPDDIPVCDARADRLMRGEIESFSQEARYLRKDGSVLFAQVNLSCVRTPAGAVDFIVATVLDISPLKKIEEKTAFQSALLEDVAEIAQIGGWSLDLRNMELFWSKELYRIHEVDLDSKLVLRDAVNFYAPEARPIIQNAVQQAIEQGISYDLELPLITAKGRRLWVRSQGKAVVENGKNILLQGTFQDITARKSKEEEVRLFQLQQETMLRNAKVGIAFVMNRTIVSCNRRFEEIFGYAPNELLGQSMRLLFPSDEEFEATGAKTYSCLSSCNHYVEEGCRLRKDGSKIRVHVSGSAVDQAHPQEGSVWCFLDISESYAVRQEAQKLLAAVEQSPAAIVITDLDANIEYANPAFHNITGYAPEEVIGCNPRILKTNATPAETYREMWENLKAGKAWKGVLYNRKKDGTHYVERAIIGPIFDHEGRLINYLAVKEDVTELRQVEQKALLDSQRFELAVRGSNDGIWDWDLRENNLFLSPRWKEQLGYADAELKNEFSTFESLLHPEDRPRVMKNARDYLSGDIERYQIEFRMLHKDGGHRWILARGECTRNENNIPIRMSGSHTDITAYKKLLQEYEESEDTLRMKSEELDRYRLHLEEIVQERTAQLSEALEAALLADRAKDEFLANVSHELRTPLNVVIGLSDLALRASKDPKQADYLEKIAKAGKNLAGIINDLLDLSKIAAGHLELESNLFRPRQTLEHCRSAMAHHAEEKGLELLVCIDEAVPDALIGDSMRVEQILFNLLSNAIKFTPSGRVEVSMNLVGRDIDRACLGIEVKDTGVGISPADAERLFKPFTQVDASITRRFGGTGLGLAICKRLAEMMGGDITVSQNEGGGSVFSVRLWLRSGSVENLPAHESVGQREVQAVRYHDVRVLAVDDQPGNLEIVEVLLTTVGIVPLLARDGQEAIDLLKEKGRAAFDLVLMDIQMPVLDGLTATQQIRQMAEFSDLPIIALTAHTMEHEKRKSLAAGFNDHIGKPFDNDKFHSILAKWIPRIKQQLVAADGGLALPDFPSIAGVDTNGGLSRLSGNAERYAHWLMTFAAEAPTVMAQIGGHLQERDSVAARKLAHALRGRAAMLGANDIQVVAASLEDVLDQGMPSGEPLAALQAAVESLCREIEQGLGEGEPQ